MVFAFDATTNQPKTGDAANITAYVSKDYGAVTVLGDTSATEMDSTNAKGYYLFDAAQAETNADCLMISAKSATANIVVIGAPAVIYTRPTTGWLAPATAGRTLVVDAAGLADANMVKAGPSGSGTAQTAGDIIGDTNDIQSRLPAALVGGRIDANMGAISADATAADNCESFFDGTGYTDVDNLSAIRSGTAAGGANGSITLDAGASAVDDFYTDHTYIQIVAGLGAGQSRFCTDYDGTTKVYTVNGNWKTNPDNTSQFIIWPFGAIAAVGSVTGAVGSVTGNVGGNVAGSVASVTGNVGGSVASVVGAVGSVTGNVGGNVAGSVASVTGNVGGNVTGSVGSVAAGGITATSVATGAIDADALATDAVNEIADGILDRNMATGTDSGADNTTTRTVRQALRALRNKVSIAAGTATITKEDDATASWTAAITTAAGNPISVSDPT